MLHLAGPAPWCREPSASNNDYLSEAVSEQASKQPVKDIVLRLAKPEDALCLSVLAMQVFLDTYATQGIRPQIAREVLSSYSEVSFAEALASKRSCIALATSAEHLVGFAQVTSGATHDRAPPGSQAELLRLYVQEHFTGMKVGTKLLRWAEHAALVAGATVLWLTPWVHNHRALAFYARRGYADHGLTHFTFEGEIHENRVMARRLTPCSTGVM